MARLSLLALAVFVTACGRAPYAGSDFGLAPLAREQFPMLDSALTGQVGQSLMVHAVENFGQQGPVRESQLGFVRFHGRLLGVDESWVSLFRAPDDTVRVSKGHITAVWLTEPPAQGRSTLLGAGLLAITALGLMHVQRPEDQPSAQTQVAVVSGAAILGGLLGRSLFGGPRRGEQLYPIRPSRTAR